eukprot:COSAG02_NODE_2621_length_8402_cov_12.631218_4_plen_97_part_00
MISNPNAPGFVSYFLRIYYRMNKPVTKYYEHKYGDESSASIHSLLTQVNEMQRRLTAMETEAKTMRTAVNQMGQHLCESNGLKVRWSGVKGLDPDA